MAYLYFGFLVLLGIVPLVVVMLRMRPGNTRREHLKRLLVAVYCQLVALTLGLGGIWLADGKRGTAPGIILYAIMMFWGIKTVISMRKEIRALSASA